MKKTYIQPTTKAYKVQPCNSMLSTSTVGVSSSDFNSSNGTIKSRQNGSFFDDDDED